MLVGYIYRHPCMQHSEFNDEYLKPLSEKFISENKEVILLGDFNIELLKCDSNKNVSDFLDIIYSTNLVPNITSPTRLTRIEQNRIMYFPTYDVKYIQNGPSYKL